MNPATTLDRLTEAIGQALACTECGSADIEHIVELRGVCTVLIPFCDPCWQRIGGEAGYDEILAEAIRLREKVRMN